MVKLKCGSKVEILRLLAVGVFVIMLALAVVQFTVPAAYADEASINQEVLNQTRAIVTAIQTRVQVYWSLWTDKSIPYIRDPLTNPAPTWASTAEINYAIGGNDIAGLTFAELDMPADRSGSFKLQVTVADSMGGSTAAALIRNYLPMATVSGSVIQVPVLRPSFAMGLQDILNKQVNRDGTTPDGGTTFLNDIDISFGANSGITFDSTTGGYIENLKTIKGDNITIDSNTLRATGDVTIDKSLTANSANITNQLSAASIVTNHLTVNGNSNFNGDIILGTDKKILGTNTITISGNGGALSKLLINATLAEFANDVNIKGKLNVVGATTGSTATYTGTVTAPMFKGDLDGNAKTATSASTLNGKTESALSVANAAKLGSKVESDLSVSRAATAGNADSATQISGTVNGVTYSLKAENGNYWHLRATKPLYVGTPIVADGNITPYTNNTRDLGSDANKWANAYATTFYGNLDGNASTATRLAAAHTISLGGAAIVEATPTAFNGTVDIAIPIKTLAAAALTGTASINTTGRANTAGLSETAQKAASLYNTDQRAVATAPNTYQNQMVFQGLKTNSVIGNPSANTYSYVLGLRGYSDNSGGNAHELAFNDSGIFARRGATDTWGAWDQIITSSMTGSLVVEKARQLETARTIALNGAVTSTAQAFNGTANITVPVIALDAAKLAANSGYVPETGVLAPPATEYQMRAKYATALYPKSDGTPLTYM